VPDKKNNKIMIEFDEPYEGIFLTVAEYAFKCAERGYNWEKTRFEILKKINEAMEYKR
jgi:hypothetical protein